MVKRVRFIEAPRALDCTWTREFRKAPAGATHCPQRVTDGTSSMGAEADLGLLGFFFDRLHHGADGVKYDLELAVVLFLHGAELAGELFIVGEEGAELDESAHDGDVDRDGVGAVQNAGKHGDALFGEGVGWVPATAVPRTRGAKLVPQVGQFCGCELEHEVFRESVQVPLDGPVERLGFDAIENRQVRIQDDFLAANQKNGGRDTFEWNHSIYGHGVAPYQMPYLDASVGMLDSHTECFNCAQYGRSAGTGSVRSE